MHFVINIRNFDANIIFYSSRSCEEFLFAGGRAASASDAQYANSGSLRS